MSAKNKKNFGFPGFSADWAREFGRRIREVRTRANLSQRELAASAGLSSPDTITRLEAGQSTRLNLELLLRLVDLASQQGLDIGYLLLRGGRALHARDFNWLITASKDDLLVELARLSADTVGVQNFLRVADDPVAKAAVAKALAPPGWSAGKEAQAMLATVRRGYRTVPPEAVPSSVDWWQDFVPVVGRIAAGIGLDAVEAREYPPGWCGEYLVYHGAPATAIAVRVDGQSMEPEYRAGDMLVVDPAQSVESGVCCILLDLDGEREPVIKRLAVRGRQAVLGSLNAEFPARTIAAAQIAGAYRIIDHLPRGG